MNRIIQTMPDLFVEVSREVERMGSELAKAASGVTGESVALAPSPLGAVSSVAGFAVLMIAAFAIPHFEGSSSLDDDWTRNTIAHVAGLLRRGGGRALAGRAHWACPALVDARLAGLPDSPLGRLPDLSSRLARRGGGACAQ